MNAEDLLWIIDAEIDQQTILARWVLEELPEIYDLAKSAERTSNIRFDAYESGNSELVCAQVRQLYKVLRNRKLRYRVEAPGSLTGQQRIRTPDIVLAARHECGCCIDLVLLLASLVYNVQVHPLITVVGTNGQPEHALLGYWTEDFTLRQGNGPSQPVLTKDLLRVHADKLDFVECNILVDDAHNDDANDPDVFQKAQRAAGRWIPEHVIFAVDVHACRKMQVQPIKVPSLQQMDEEHSLSRFLISFKAFIDDRTQGFVGRGFVFRAFDDFRNSDANSSGYFVVRGVPGVGKSALTAQLVKQRNYIHHFNIPGCNNAYDFLKNVCAQLILRYNLPYATLPDKTQELARQLNRLLEESSAQVSPDNHLVIAIDALNEVDTSDTPLSANALFLPPSLPTNVFCFLTSTGTDRLRLQVSAIGLFDIDPTADDNTDDVKDYIRAWLPHKGILSWIDSRRLTTNDFIEGLLTKSEGNFMYLHYVIPAIANGVFGEGSVADLPHGLIEYYRGHWAKMESCSERDEFRRWYKPVVCALATARGPLPVPKIMEYAELKDEDEYYVRKVIREWSEFLYCEEGLYRIYHDSFRAFLRDDIGLQKAQNKLKAAIGSKIDPRSP